MQSSGFRVWGLHGEEEKTSEKVASTWFMCLGLRFHVDCLGFGVWGLSLGVWGLGLGVEG